MPGPGGAGAWRCRCACRRPVGAARDRGTGRSGECRTALEAALTEGVWRRQLRDGRSHGEIEAMLEEARVRLTLLAALALAGDSRRGADVLPRLNSWGRSFADTYQALNHGAHGAHTGDPDRLIHGTKALVEKIRASLP